MSKIYDVIVCGGGFAGIAAALASARKGKKTVLFEKQYMLGGLGTAGIITVISYPIVGVFGAVVAAPFVPTMVLAGICLLTTMSFLVKAITTPDFKWRKDGIGIGFFLATKRKTSCSQR